MRPDQPRDPAAGPHDRDAELDDLAGERDQLQIAWLRGYAEAVRDAGAILEERDSLTARKLLVAALRRVRGA